MSEFENELRQIDDVGFRDIAGQLLYIECKDILEKMAPTEGIRSNATGLITYAYIDHTGGLSCWPVVIASVMGNALQIFSLSDSNVRYIFRINEGEKEYAEELNGMKLYMCHITPDHRFCNANVFGKLVDDFKSYGEIINKQYDMENPDRKFFRNNTEFDHIRNKYWPDDLQVLLAIENNNVEVVWVRSEFASKDEYVGELLNEPYQDFGVHAGEFIGFVEYEMEDGELALVSTLNVWKRRGLS